jgi:transporter family-2 protein
MLYYILPIIGGFAVTLQVIMNAILEKHIGKIWTTLISHLTGTIFAIGLILIRFSFTEKISYPIGIKFAPWYSLTGGLFGFSVVFFVLISSNKVSFTVILSLVTIGQLLFGAFVDHVGLFNFSKNTFTFYKFIGICMIALGVYFIKK